MYHANDAVAATLSPAPGWTLHSGGRQFGPMSDDELRRFFTSGVVTQADTLTNAVLGLTETADEAAARLQVVAPKPAQAATPLPPPVRHLNVQRVESTGVRTAILALVMLALAGVYMSMPAANWRQLAPKWTGVASGNWVAEANQLEDRNDWNGALAHAQRWVATAPSANAWLYEGRALARLQHPEDAERAFRRGLALAPNDNVLLSNLAALAFEQQRYGSAVQAWQAAVRIDPSVSGDWYMLGRAYSLLSRDAEALAAFRKATSLNSGESGGWTELGFTLYRLGRMAEAVAPLERAIALEPGYQRPQQILAAVRDVQGGRQPSAPIVAAAAAAPAPESADAANALAPAPIAPEAPGQAAASAAQWEYWPTEAGKLEDAEDWTGLRNFAERWTQAQPQNAYAWSALGTALRNLRQWDAAIKAHQRAAELAPNDTLILFRLGLSYSTNLDWLDAIPVYQRVLSLNPRDSMAWNNLGSAYDGAGQLQSAIDAYKNAVQLDRHNIVAWNNLGRMYYESNHFAESIDAFQTALSMAPDNETAKVGLQRAKQR